MSKKLGNLIKEARTAKGFTQAELAAKVDGLSAAALGKAERGEAEPTEEVVRAIAKMLGVTQTSLVEALSGKTSAKTSSSKTSSSKTSSAKTASSKTSSSKTSSSKTSSAKKTSKTTSGTGMKLTAAEKQLVELYRGADSNVKKAVMSLLKGETMKPEEFVGSILESAIGLLGGNK